VPKYPKSNINAGRWYIRARDHQRPLEITQVERRAVTDSAYGTMAAELHLVKQVMMAAIGRHARVKASRQFGRRYRWRHGLTSRLYQCLRSSIRDRCALPAITLCLIRRKK
jgi:hypothetical protein